MLEEGFKAVQKAESMDAVRAAHQLGQIVKGKVYRVFPYGVLLRLDDGTPAIIYPRELSLSVRKPDPREIVHPGQRLKGKIIRIREDGSLELSRRLVDHDPWEDIEEHYSVGQEVEGEVIKVKPFGAFVEIEPGLIGLVPKSEIDPDKEVEQVEDVLWEGDYVKAIISSITPSQRRLSLSIKEYVRRMRRRMAGGEDEIRAPIVELIDEDVRLVLSQQVESLKTSPVKLLPWKPERIRRILIVDDSEEFRRPLKAQLESWDFEVECATGGREALERVREDKDIDFALIDIHLPDVDGIEVAKHFQEAGIPSALITGFLLTEEESDKLEEEGWLVLFKPLDMDELEELLKGLEEKGRLPVLPKPDKKREREDFFRRVAIALERGESLSELLKAPIKEVQQKTGAKAVALFALDMDSGECSVIEQVGFRIDEAKARYVLRFSPVGDVIREKVPLLEHDVTRARRRFRRLLEFYTFRSCIGVPVLLPRGAPDTGYALFLFHPAPRHFQEIHLEYAKAAAMTIGALLYEKMSRERLYAAQKLILAGQLGAGAIHEITNRVSGLPYMLQKLRERYQEYEEGRVTARDLCPLFKETIQEVNEAINYVLCSISHFRRLSRAETVEEVNVNDVVLQVVDQLRPLAFKQKVVIETNLDPGIPTIRTIEVHLEHVFYNILLNGIQWASGRPKAEVEVITSFEPAKDGARPIKIRFKDNGLGIHRQLWERIYDLGFSTKEGGTGLGLYIAKGLVESLGGHIKVEESYILAGSTFLVELPA